jgi:cysteine desulfurase / selenocysteine lyase
MNIDTIRREFPITEDIAYLDNASLSPLPRCVVAAAAAELEDRSRRGVDGFWSWLDVIDDTRAKVAALLGATADEVTFLQNTSEGINVVANMIDWQHGDNVVINDLEYYPNAYPWLKLAARGVEPRVVRHTDGSITPAGLGAVVDRRTRVVAISHVAWINGLRHDLVAISDICRASGAYLCVDAIQSLGAGPVSVADGRIDFLASGSHKWLMAPLGLGIFYCRQELIERFEPPFVGWQSDDRGFSSQEYGFRDHFTPGSTARRFNHGNINVAAVHGLHASMSMLEDIGWERVFARNRMLSDRVVAGLSALGVRFLSPLDAGRRSNIVNAIPNDLQRTLAALKAARIAVSTRAGGVRISPAVYNTEEEIDWLVAVFARTA